GRHPERRPGQGRPGRRPRHRLLLRPVPPVTGGPRAGGCRPGVFSPRPSSLTPHPMTTTPEHLPACGTPSDRWALPDDVFLAGDDPEARLVDLNRSRFYALDPVARRMVELAVAAGDAGVGP